MDSTPGPPTELSQPLSLESRRQGSSNTKCMSWNVTSWVRGGGSGSITNCKEALLVCTGKHCLPQCHPHPDPWWLLCEGCSPFPNTPASWQREIPSLQRVILNTRADEKVTTQGLYGGKLKWPIVRIIKQNLTKYDSEKGWRDGEWILPFQSWRPSARIHVARLFPK